MLFSNYKLPNLHALTTQAANLLFTYRHKKTRTSVSKSVFWGPEKTYPIEETCRNPRVYIIQAHTYTSTRKCGYTHEHLLMSCYRIGCEISQVSKHRIASVSKRHRVSDKVAKGWYRSAKSAGDLCLRSPHHNLTVASGTLKVANALLCPQSPPNRFLGTPLYPSPKATAWVLHLLTVFIVRQRDEFYLSPIKRECNYSMPLMRNFGSRRVSQKSCIVMLSSATEYTILFCLLITTLRYVFGKWDNNGSTLPMFGICEIALSQDCVFW